MIYTPAKAYADWPVVGEVYIRQGVFYLKVKNPYTQRIREVKAIPSDRNYTYASELMKIFGFKDKDDYICIIKEKEVRNVANICKPWSSRAFYDGSWIADKETPAPPNVKVHKVTWPELVAEAQRLARKNKTNEADSPWLNILEDK